MNLLNKKVFITGGTKGLGFSLAKIFIDSGCEVHVIGSSKESVNNAKEQLNSSKLFVYECDVTDFSLLNEIATKIDGIDILINNAGIWLEGQLTDNDPSQISKVTDVNINGVIYTTKVFLPFMLKANEGFIINISSTSGLKGRENQSVYVASKFAVRGFTESLKEDLAKTNIKVVGFYPGGMNTELFSQAGFPKQNSDWMNTDKVANIIKFIIEQDDKMLLDHVVLNKRNAKSSN